MSAISCLQLSHIGIHGVGHTPLTVFNAHMAGGCRFLLSYAPLITPITKGVGGRPASTMGSQIDQVPYSRLHASSDFRKISFGEPGKAHNVPRCMLQAISGTFHFESHVRPTMFQVACFR